MLPKKSKGSVKRTPYPAGLILAVGESRDRERFLQRWCGRLGSSLHWHTPEHCTSLHLDVLARGASVEAIMGLGGIDFIPFPELALSWATPAALSQWGVRDRQWLGRPAWGRSKHTLGGLRKEWSREAVGAVRKHVLDWVPLHSTRPTSQGLPCVFWTS